jgi:hypothetical protein
MSPSELLPLQPLLRRGRKRLILAWRLLLLLGIQRLLSQHLRQQRPPHLLLLLLLHPHLLLRKRTTMMMTIRRHRMKMKIQLQRRSWPNSQREWQQLKQPLKNSPKSEDGSGCRHTAVECTYGTGTKARGLDDVQDRQDQASGNEGKVSSALIQSIAVARAATFVAAPAAARSTTAAARVAAVPLHPLRLLARLLQPQLLALPRLLLPQKKNYVTVIVDDNDVVMVGAVDGDADDNGLLC